MLVSSWSLVNDRSTSPPQSLHARNFSRIHRPGRRASPPTRSRESAVWFPGSPGSPPRSGATPAWVHGVALARRQGLLVAFGATHGDEVEVEPGHVGGVEVGNVGADDRTPIAALGAVALVTKLGHQRGEGTGNAARVPARLRCRTGEAVAGQRRRHHVECVPRLTAVSDRIGERPDHAEELGDRARPAVGQEEGQGPFMRGAGMDEVDPLPFDRSGVLGERLGSRSCARQSYPSTQ